MGYAYGDIQYDYKIRIDLSSFIEAILEQIEGWEDYEIDGDTLVISGSTSNRGKSYYSPATMYDPPEYDLEFTEYTVNEWDFELIVVNACDKFKEYLVKNNFVNGGKSISECKLDEDHFEFEPDEPDENDAYDRYRDRQLEEG